MNAPNYLNIDLSQNEVRTTLQNIFDDMTRIRTEARNRIPDNVIKDEYMHLTYRLASAMDALASDKDFNKMQKLVNSIDTSMLSYDPDFDNYWRGKNKGFINDLESALLNLRGDRFLGIDEKHHVFQALKFLGAKDEKNKQVIYDSILPKSTPTFMVNNSKIQSVVDFFFAKDYNVEIKDDEVIVNGIHKHVDDKIFAMVNNTGFSKLTLTERVNNIARKDYVIISNSDVKYTKPFDKVMSKIVKYSMPVSYTLLGLMPEKVRDNLGERWSFNARDSFLASSWVESFGGAIGAIVTSIVTKNPYHLIWGGYCVVEGIVRGVAFNEEREENGALPVKILFSPFEKKLSNKIKYQQITFKLNPRANEIYNDKTLGNLEQVAALILPEDVKKSLIYTPENNHFTFGELFDDYMIKDPVGKGVAFTKNRQNSNIYFSESQMMDNYQKSHFLIYDSDKNYLITRISKKTNEQSFIEKFDLHDKNIIDKLGKDAAYLRFRTYESGKVTSDLEVNA